jgi:general secretion pathway protein A
MSYYKVLGLQKEPFSTSPDPSFFFLSEEHKAALLRLQIAISLRRGLSVILGDVGTGKTTLSRKLSQALSRTKDVSFHMILNPHFENERQFLSRLAALFHLDVSPSAEVLELMEAVERFLFRRGVEESKIVVLLIDEAQILPDFALETLRILLNYETNEFKILQLVLVGQMELLPRLRERSNFWDRIALRFVLNPLGEQEVRRLIDFRLRQAGHKGDAELFTDGAVRAICRHSQGYPRRLALLCHNALESLVMYDAKVVDEALVNRLLEADSALGLGHCQGAHAGGVRGRKANASRLGAMPVDLSGWFPQAAPASGGKAGRFRRLRQLVGMG